MSEVPPSQVPAPQVQDTVFLRKASGVIRTMSSRDAMYYGYLAATGLYALIVFLFVGAADFPRANIWIANILALAIFLAVYVVYSNLSSAMPRSGGDYVFQSRLLKPSIGFTVTWGTWILWGFFYVFMAASAILSAFISPLLSAIGVATGVHAWTTAAADVTLWYVKIPIIFALILLSTWVMLAGMRPYLRIQRVVMMPLAIGGVVLLLVTYVAFSHKTFINHFNSFQAHVGGLPAQDVISKAHALGFRATQSGWFDTLAFAVGLAGFYVWTTWSAELLGEIKQASQLRTSFSMYAGAGILQFITFAIGLGGAYWYFGRNWLQSMSWLTVNHPTALGGSWDFRGVSTLFYIPSLNIVFGVVLFLCFLAPTAQSLFNPTLCSSRLLLAMSFDRVLPDWFGEVNGKGVPSNAIWFCSIIAMLLTVAIQFETRISEVWFWASFATFLGLFGSLIAGTIFPYRQRSIYDVSPGAPLRVLGIPAITFFGVISAVCILGVLVVNLAAPGFGMLAGGSARWGLVTMIVAYVLFAIFYFVMKSVRAREGIDVSLAFKVIPRA
jgi:APA family basic amino acid/polyamine antiporter